MTPNFGYTFPIPTTAGFAPASVTIPSKAASAPVVASSSKVDDGLLQALWRSSDKAHFLASRNPQTKAFKNHHIHSIEAAAKLAADLQGQGHDVYFACAEFTTSDNRTQVNANGAFAFWVDVDCGADKATAGKGYSDLEEARGALTVACTTLNIPAPNWSVCSGYGLHAYWTLTEPLPAERWKAVARKLKMLFAKIGFHADPSRTDDISSVLRLPGTINHKSEPGRPVTMLERSSVHIDTDLMTAAIEREHRRLYGAGEDAPADAGLSPSEPAVSASDIHGKPSMAQLESALSYLDPDCGDKTWKFHRIAPLVNLAKEYPEDAAAYKDLARRWSRGDLSGRPSVKWLHATDNGKAGKDVFDSFWAYLFVKQDFKGRPATVGTIFRDARELGWSYDRDSEPVAPQTKPVIPPPPATSVGAVQPPAVAPVSTITPPTAAPVSTTTPLMPGVIQVPVTSPPAPPKPVNAGGDAAVLPFPVREPYHLPVALPALLDEIVSVIRTYIVVEAAQADALALWVVHTYLSDIAEVSPLLIITAPERACAKTQLQEVVGALSHRPVFAANATSSALFRSVGKWQPTLLIDEADTFIEGKDEFQGMINAGYKRGGAVLRTETVGNGFDPVPFPVYSPKSLAGIGLEQRLADATLSRGIVIRMRRKLSHEKVQRLRKEAREHFDQIASKAVRCAQDCRDQVERARPDLPDALSDRQQDNWEPLLAIAQVAGCGWYERACNAACVLSVSNDPAGGLSNELLADIKEVFESRSQATIKTADLINVLCSDDEKAWATYNRGQPITPRQLSKLLGLYGLGPKTVRQRDGSTPKGYDVADFKDAFNRYLLGPASSTSTVTLEPPQGAGVAATPQQEPDQGAADDSEDSQF